MALSIKQPWAELIMRGVKTIEVRSLRTHKRARVQIYASKGGVSLASCERIEKEHGVDVKSLPRGVLVGTIEIVGCRPLAPTDSTAAAFWIDKGDPRFAWMLAEPRRSLRLIKPRKQPQPTFFRPF
jgi:ASCH domain